MLVQMGETDEMQVAFENGTKHSGEGECSVRVCGSDRVLAPWSLWVDAFLRTTGMMSRKYSRIVTVPLFTRFSVTSSGLHLRHRGVSREIQTFEYLVCKNLEIIC